MDPGKYNFVYKYFYSYIMGLDMIVLWEWQYLSEIVFSQISL